MKLDIIVDKDMEYLLEDHSWYNHNGYAMASIDGKAVLMHHVIIGRPPAGLETDHINRNRLDNRRCNLRHVTRRENLLNRKFTNRSGYLGVYFDKHSKRSKPYKAMLRRHGKDIHLGYYSTAVEASRAVSEYISKE